MPFPLFGKYILLVDDNVSTRELIKDMMEIMKCRLDFAGDGQEAVEKWQNNKYDLIIMDLYMPRMDGYRATEEIRRLENNQAHIPILGLTASGLSHERNKCLISGMDDFLNKPVNIDTLEKKLLEIFSKFK